jgi:CheY-like chemotaxis protein
MRGTILLVDDEAAVRGCLRRFLELAGYAVLEAEQGRAALDVLARHPDVELVVTDLSMPVMGGHALAAAIARSRPDLPIVFMSADVAALKSLALFGAAHLAKPCSPDDLLATIGASLDVRASVTLEENWMAG